MVELVNVVSAVGATIGAMVGYLQIAKRRFWWPFNPRLPAPLKAELKRLLTASTGINPSTHVEVTLKELDGDHLWLGVVFRQSMRNISKRTEPMRSQFKSNGRRYRNFTAQLDNRTIAPSSETESAIVVSSHLDPLQTRTLEVKYEMAYHDTDSELFVSYLAGEEYYFSVVDAISEAAGRRLFVLETEPLMSADKIGRADITNIAGRPYSRQFSITGGFSPSTGVYLRWRRTD